MAATVWGTVQGGVIIPSCTLPEGTRVAIELAGDAVGVPAQRQRIALARICAGLVIDTALGFVLFSLPVFVLYLLLSILFLSFSYSFPSWLFQHVLTVIAFGGGLGAVVGLALCFRKRFHETRVPASPWWQVLSALARLPGSLGRFIMRPRRRWYLLVSGFGVGLLLVCFFPVGLPLPAEQQRLGLLPTLGQMLWLFPDAHFPPLTWEGVCLFAGWNIFLAMNYGLVLGFLALWTGDLGRWLTKKVAG